MSKLFLLTGTAPVEKSENYNFKQPVKRVEELENLVLYTKNEVTDIQIVEINKENKVQAIEALLDYRSPHEVEMGRRYPSEQAKELARKERQRVRELIFLVEAI